jgi:hypothetical protein
MNRVIHTIRLHSGWTTDGSRSTRHFGAPRTVDAGDTVWLVASSGPLNALLNGETVTLPVDVSQRLQPRNVLVVDLPPGVALPSVMMEIRRPGG